MSKNEKPKYKNRPFTDDDIQDVRIIIKANDKHYAIVPDEHISTRKKCSEIRKGALRAVLTCHNIVIKPLEEMRPDLISTKEN